MLRLKLNHVSKRGHSLTCDLSQKLIEALNSYGQLLQNKDIPVVFLSITI